MALKAANDRATMAQVSLGAGLASFLVAVTIRRLRSERRDPHAVSSRGQDMAPPVTAPFIMEHIQRLHDPDYVCLAIAENKLTVGEAES